MQKGFHVIMSGCSNYLFLRVPIVKWYKLHFSAFQQAQLYNFGRGLPQFNAS